MRPLLGTFVEIAASGDPARLPRAVAAAYAAIERVQQLMSFHDPRSDVSRINAAPAGESVRIDPETRAVLGAAREIGDLSAGAFDIAIAPVLMRSGALPVHGTFVRDAANATTYRDLHLRPGSRVRWRHKGCIDLGGIAKGFAVDRAIEALRRDGIESAVVNAGGDLRCFGDPQPLYVRESDDPGVLRIAGELRDGAAATSADSFRPQALVDPAGRRCTSWHRSVTVLARDCMSADALTKVVALAPDEAARVLRHFGAMHVGAEVA
ncbi:MAG: FAD:protein FMN transferase [Steroidobacteraceae bacterium]